MMLAVPTCDRVFFCPHDEHAAAKVIQLVKAVQHGRAFAAPAAIDAFGVYQEGRGNLIATRGNV